MKERAKRARPAWSKLHQPKQGGGMKHKYLETPKKKVERPYPWEMMDVLGVKKRTK